MNKSGKRIVTLESYLRADSVSVLDDMASLVIVALPVSRNSIAYQVVPYAALINMRIGKDVIQYFQYVHHFSGGVC